VAPATRIVVHSQIDHVIDVASIVLQAAGLPEPKAVNGTKQRPMDGVSMLYSFDNPRAKGRRTTKYFEMFGNRTINSSFVTLATLGYGDIVPRTDVARGLAIVEGVGGQLFLAVMVARLVSLYTRGQETKG
jgi:Ion channel